MAWTTGLQALQGAVKEGQDRAREREEGGDFQRLPGYFSWKPAQKRILRFLTNDILTEDFFQNIVCNDGKPRSFLVDPNDPDRLLRYVSDTPGIGWKKEFGTGELVEPWCGKQTVGIAVEREEVLRDGKMMVQDKEEKPGEKFYGIVQQAISNFWDPLVSSIYERYGDITGRDIEVIRTGTNKQTVYSFPPLQAVPELEKVEAVQAAYFYGYQDNKEDPDRLKKCPMTLSEWAAYFSSEERHARWLTPKNSSAPTGGVRDTQPAAQPSGDEAQTTSSGPFSSLRDNLIKNQDGPPF
jgi:hypothetical protein